MKRAHTVGLLVIAAAALPLAGCGKKESFGPPPRATDTITVPAQDSVIAVPVTADLSSLAASLEKEIPRTLYTINEPGQTCVAPKRVKVLGIKIKTPQLKCDIVGTVTRGSAQISGQGQDVIVTFPVHAVVHARDIGGILKQETATADAKVRAKVHLTIDGNWNPRAKVDIAYDWTNAPHVEFLGKRIEFTQAANKELQPVIARLERTLPQELAKLDLRSEIDRLWRSAYTSLQLNESNPPVWMRVTPQQLQYGGFTLSGSKIALRLGMKARTETFVGDRPADPPAKPLPAMAALDKTPGKIAFFIPVIADYKQLEPVVQKALVKRSARPFELPGIGAVDGKFGAVEIYGTTGGRIAAGVTFTATPRDSKYGNAHGRVWLTGTPVNAANSRKVSFTDLAVTGDTDHTGADLLLKLANSPGFSQTVAEALAQNFENDYGELMGKISRAISTKREGDLTVRAHIESVETGQLKAAGQGLYLPVRGTGTASIALTPR